ncbi:MAG: hypothetical protein WCO63_07435 [Bacteroidota bacterium]
MLTGKDAEARKNKNTVNDDDRQVMEVLNKLFRESEFVSFEANNSRQMPWESIVMR